MKILQINSLFTPRRFGGAEVFLERLSAELVDRGHQVLVACLSPTPTRHGTEQLQVHEFALRNVYWPFDQGPQPAWRKVVWHVRNSFGTGGACDIDALLEREQPDLVHTHNLSGFTSAVWKTVRARGIPLVHTIHDYALLCMSHTMFRGDSNCGGQCLGCRVLSYPKREHSQAVDAVVGVSAFALERHLRSGYFSQAAPYVVQNGNPSEPAAGDIALRTTAEKLRVGYLGRLAPSKGIELMLESLAPLTPHSCQVAVGGAGDASYEAHLKQRFESDGVRFLGKVQATEFLASVDVLVVPSLWHEPFGLVLCEAISAGVPVVASAVGGIPEVIQHGQCGLLFDRADGTALRAHVQELAADPDRRRQMADRCRVQAAEHAFDRTVDRYLHVYEQTLN
jgi:glycosyltransferase involved in cell wall biosynthesis